VATSPMSKVIDHLRKAVLAGGETQLTDGQLLECFVNHRDEAAVAALVRRHGPMVWGVCRRILHSHQDAEDAFQATFLVLVRKAASIIPREMAANWLYGVAHQTARKARATTAKRQAQEKQVNEMPEPAAGTEPDLWRDLQPLLDQELSRLPDKYRLAIVLCDLEGKTRKEAARQLKIPEGTLSSRLTTARTMLAKRLARHGLAVSGGALAAVLVQNAASAGLPTSVVSNTIKATSLLAAGQAATTGVISAKVAALTEGMLKTMLLAKLKMMTAMLLALSLVTLTSALLAWGQTADKSDSAEKPAPKPEKPVAKQVANQKESEIASKTLPTLRLVRILAKGKTFTIGSPPEEKGREENETAHEVTLSADYYLGVTTVTRGQFAAFVKEDGYQTEAERDGKGAWRWNGDQFEQKPEYTWKNPGFKSIKQTDEHPVVNVSWNDAVAFSKWLSRKDGREYRLPTEAEWEYACRSGTKTAYSFGDDPSKLVDYAWFGDNAGGTHTVGTKKPNGWGLYDMHGNVWQWCADWYGEYAKGAVTDPQGPKEGSKRVYRGCSWMHDAQYCRSAYRDWRLPTLCINNLGFRLAAPVR
jgi:RNA polymerase sigma factor (sigma-70 family)